MLARAPGPAVRADARELPSPDRSFDAVALLYVLYHLPEPERALAEAHRVLRPGGLLAVAAPSRHDAPELAFVLSPDPLTFDAEAAPRSRADEAARTVHLPLSVTKRGCLAFARRA